MTNDDRAQGRREAAEFWDSHGIDEGAQDFDVEERVEVRKPLSAMLSIRLDQDDLSQLKVIAGSQGVGVTTMARMLLHKGLDGARNRLELRDLRPEPAVRKIAEVHDPVPDEDADREFLVLSRGQLRRIEHLVARNAVGLLVEGLKDHAISVTPREGELFDKINELHSADWGPPRLAYQAGEEH